MLRDPITVLVQSTVAGPNGKLKVGEIVKLADSEYVRILVNSGTVSLIDPPSLDPVFLERAGYVLREGYKEQEPEVFLVRKPKKKEEVKMEDMGLDEKSLN